jgi:hypothetical protein
MRKLQQSFSYRRVEGAAQLKALLNLPSRRSDPSLLDSSAIWSEKQQGSFVDVDFPDQSLLTAAPQDRLEDTPQEIALAEAPMPVLREGGMVGHIDRAPS